MIFKQMYSGGGGFVLNITSNVANPNIPALASAAGWDGSGFLKVNITASFVNRLILLSSWSFPSGLEVEISSGTLVGGRGDGSFSEFSALVTAIPVSIRNMGTIAGAGGGGGLGGFTFFTYAGNTCSVGKDVFNVAAGGFGQGFSGTSTTPMPQSSGETGGHYAYTGPLFGGDTRPWAIGGNGGNGGAWGQHGTNGGFGTVGGSYNSSGSDPFPANGGNPGNSVIGNSFITWLATGTRLGPISA